MARRGIDARTQPVDGLQRLPLGTIASDALWLLSPLAATPVLSAVEAALSASVAVVATAWRLRLEQARHTVGVGLI